MAVTFRNLVGTRENLDKTIRALLEDNWTVANTDKIRPRFESDTEEPDYLARVDSSAATDIIFVSWILRQRSDEPEDEALGDSIHLWEELIVINFETGWSACFFANYLTVR